MYIFCAKKQWKLPNPQLFILRLVKKKECEQASEKLYLLPHSWDEILFWAPITDKCHSDSFPTLFSAMESYRH